MRSCRMCSRQKMRGIKWRCCRIWVQTAQDALIKLCFSVLPLEVSRCSIFEKGFWDRIGLGELGIRFQLTSFAIFTRGDHGLYFSIHFRSSKRLFSGASVSKSHSRCFDALGTKRRWNFVVTWLQLPAACSRAWAVLVFDRLLHPAKKHILPR